MTAKGPLSGITVIDLTRVLAGPYCTMVLADLGARVIKVEVPGAGDDSRHIGPFVNGKSAYFISVNRGKESIALNLKDEADLKILHALLARADVIAENFRAGTMEKLGLGYETLKTLYPRLIYAATSGFGHTGPYATRPAYDVVVQGMGGIMSITGEEGGTPVRVGSSIGDITAGLFTAIGVASALYHRAQTGEAMKIDVGMLDCQVALLENAIARYQATGDVPGPIGTRHPSITPFQAFATADGFVIIAAGNDKLFATLCNTIARPDLAQDERFRTNALRSENVLALQAELESALTKASGAVWLERLEAAGLPCGPVNSIADVCADEHVQARTMIVSAEDSIAGTVKMAGNPIKSPGIADSAVKPSAPDLDADRAAILGELGLGGSKG